MRTKGKRYNTNNPNPELAEKVASIFNINLDDVRNSSDKIVKFEVKIETGAMLEVFESNSIEVAREVVKKFKYDLERNVLEARKTLNLLEKIERAK